MKALTLTQPWATLLVHGEKRIETRGFRPVSLTPGEWFLVHAARHITPAAWELITAGGLFTEALRRHGYPQQGGPHVNGGMPTGAIVGAVRYRDSASTDKLVGVESFHEAAAKFCGWPVPLSEKERAFGNYGPERHGWLTSDPKVLTMPVACRGKLGLWQVDDAIRRQVIRIFHETGIELSAA